MTPIPLSRPPVDDEIKQAVMTAMDSRQWILGPQCKEFEKELASYVAKNLTVMGDGGAVVTDDDEIAARCRRLRDHGRLNKDVHAEVGFNLRFNDIQVAIGRVLLRRLDMMNERRRQLARRYAKGLDGMTLELPRERPGARHVYHLYVVRTPRRAKLAAFLKERGIQTGVHYPVPGHRQPDEILTLPISAGHTDAELDTVAMTVRAFFGA